MCKVSVVTSVYNCENYIAETIESVINQTFEDWEFIIINDCSKDKSAEIIKSFNDKRIRFIDNESNQGQCKNLNMGISMARGEYIARLDHDDICYPDRFKKQIEYLDTHPEVVLCGSWTDYWENGEIIKKECPPIKGADELSFSLCFRNYGVPHSSFMIRKSVMINNNIWYGDYLYAEDYDLLFKLLQVGKISYIPEALVIYRVFPEQCTQTYSEKLILGEEEEIRCSYLNRIDFTDKEILKKAVKCQLKTRKDYKQFSDGLISYMNYYGLHLSKQELKNNECLKLVFLDMCFRQKKNFALLVSYITSPFKNNSWLFTLDGIVFIIKCIIHYNH